MTALVHIVDDVPELDGLDELTLVVSLYGFLDAGNAAVAASDHLEAVSDGAPGAGKVVATFDVDQFHDYRARRPAMSFVRDHYEQYDAPRLLVRLHRDSAGTPFLLLRGTRAGQPLGGVLRQRPRGRRAVRRHPRGPDRRRADGRPAHPTDRRHSPRVAARAPHRRLAVARRAAHPLQRPEPARARLGDWGHDALGYVAHVPHYLAQLDYPQAAIALLEAVELGGRLTVDLSTLREEGDERELEISRYLAGNSEVSEVVTALEQQYDTFREAETSGSSLLAEDQPMPTGEEIGRQFEQFLAGLEDD